VDTHTVSVNHGLFNTLIEGCTTSEINGKQLYLGVEVSKDGVSDREMTPRQPIYPVPYAFSLVPGAELSGDLNTKPMLDVQNSSGVALYAGGSGIFQSSAKSYLFIPSTAIVATNPGSTYLEIHFGSVRIYPETSGSGSRKVIFPITIPGVLYGQNVYIDEIRIYYVCDESSSFIEYTTVYRQTGASTFDLLVDDDTPQTSTTATFYTPLFETSADATLSSESGPLTLQLDLNFADDDEYIQIGMVRLTLGHD
jgi:hypothetical protein